MRVDLVDTASGQVVGGITTHLIYTDAAAGTQRLRFALVLPLRTAIVAAPAPTASQLLARPAAALATPSAAMTAVVDTVGGHRPDHPPCRSPWQASAQTVGALQPTGHQADGGPALGHWPPPPRSTSSLSTPFAPVNASGLVAAGLSDELAMQVARGTNRHLGPGHPPGRYPRPDLGTWITDDGLDTAASTSSSRTATAR